MPIFEHLIGHKRKRGRGVLLLLLVCMMSGDSIFFFFYDQAGIGAHRGGKKAIRVLYRNPVHRTPDKNRSTTI
jgi:hypothetical protein